MITISTHAPRMILSRQRAGMNGIFDHYRAVDQNGGEPDRQLDPFGDLMMRGTLRFGSITELRNHIEQSA
jgi:hypothetical protein